jgi:hypothetical protein
LLARLTPELERIKAHGLARARLGLWLGGASRLINANDLQIGEDRNATRQPGFMLQTFKDVKAKATYIYAVPGGVGLKVRVGKKILP